LNTNYRGSDYRGVSRNKLRWQVSSYNTQMMISLLGKKIYKGGFKSAEEAAEFYDKLSINVFGLNVSLAQDLGMNQSTIFLIRN